MIPKLYASTETAFTSEGLGRLTDATRCEVTEERNGIYELVLEYPVGGPMINKIQVGRYIGATHDDDQDVQPFEIYKVSAPIRGVVTVNAWHISYKLNSVAVLPFTADSCANALAAIGTNSLNTNPFTFWTDKAVAAPFELTVPKNARNILGGETGSILDVYGKGEYEFDKYTVKLWTNRGVDNGVEIRYGKNLTALDYQQNGASVYNAVAPFWTNDSTTVYLDHLVVRTGETAGNAIALDLSGEFDEEPTAAQLEAVAQAYIDASDNYEIKENIKIDFYPIWEADERYEAEQVRLCDTVTIIFEGYNIRAKAKAIKVVYDTLRDRYKYIELGEPKATFAQEVTALVSDNIMGSVEGLVKRTAADAIPDASATERGLVSTGDQTFAGKKTFNHRIIANASSTGDGATGSIVAQGGNPSIVSYNTALNKYIELVAGSSGNRGLYTGDGWVLYLGGDGKVHFGQPVDATNLPVASATEAGIVSTGTQTFAGEKVFSGDAYFYSNAVVAGNDTAPRLKFRPNSNNSSNDFGWIYLSTPATNGVYRTDRFYFREYSYNSTTGERLATQENYRLPAVNANRTENNTYEILTTKETATAGTITPASGRTLSSSSYLKKWGGHFVEFYVELTGGAYSTNGWNTVATFPTGFRPSAAFDFIGLDNGASTQSNLGLDCKMTSSGLLQVYKSASMTPTNNIRIHGTFII